MAIFMACIIHCLERARKIENIVDLGNKNLQNY